MPPINALSSIPAPYIPATAAHNTPAPSSGAPKVDANQEHSNLGSQSPRQKPRPNPILMARFASSQQGMSAVENGGIFDSEDENVGLPGRVHLRGGGPTHSDSARVEEGSQQAPTYFNPVPPKCQTRMADCWYPAMMMVLRGKHGEGYKAVGDTVKSARGLPLIGKKLSFGSREGQRIMDDNGLVAVGDKLELGDSQSVADLLDRHGPFLVAGTYDFTNLGHCVVVVGVDHATQKVCIQDPIQNNARAQWYALDYLKNTYRNPNSVNIDMAAVIALQPNL